MQAIRLKTEHLSNPLGIDITRPELSWNCREGMLQTAYQIICRDESGSILWDSGKVRSGSMHAVYAGKQLISRSRVSWKVILWDERDEEGPKSEEAFFEEGLLEPGDWTAKWITGNYRVNKKLRYPVDCFRKNFSIGRIRRARLYVTACGLYEGRINGKKIGDYVLTPGITDYRKRVQYQTYDLTELLSAGENSLTFRLADGWYRGSTGAWGLKNQYGTETRILAQLEITEENGSITTVCSDESWEWSNDGPIRFADNKDGETVIASMEETYSGHAKVTGHNVTPTASNNVPVREKERFSPKLTKTPSGKSVLDFGQNIAGYVEFRLTAEEGQRVFLRFGEMLDEKGEFTQKNIQCSNKHITTPLQQVEYVCRAGENHYKTTFAVFGFRYILIETDVKFDEECFTAIAVYSDMERTGFFESSSELLNRFAEATVWSAKGNFLDIPTDCPTRERHGWTGDAQIFFDTAGYFFDVAPFARKYLNDMYDWQTKSGRLPQIAPAGGVDFYMWVMNGSVGWSDAGILIPYRYSRLYGTDRILKEFYPGMKKYAEFMMNRCGKWGGPFAKKVKVKGKAGKYVVNRGQSYGEWAEPADVHVMKWTDFAAPHPEESTAYTAYVMEVMRDIAERLGKEKDAELFAEYAQGCRDAYQAMAETEGFTLDTDRQARLVRPLALNLLNDEQKAFARKRLIKALENYDWRLGTGFLSTPLILDVLAEIDIEAAYRLLENRKMPGWLYMAENGATTIWEAWEGTEAQDGIASLNHYSKGAVCQWLFKTMCGIEVDGENHFRIAPRPGGSITHASASYNSVYGLVESRWRINENSINFEITVPCNCSAEILLPDGRRENLTAGNHTLKMESATQEEES